MIACFFSIWSGISKMMKSLILNPSVFNSSTHQVCLSVILKRNSFLSILWKPPTIPSSPLLLPSHYWCRGKNLFGYCSLIVLFIVQWRWVVLFLVYPYTNHIGRGRKITSTHQTSKSDNLWCHHAPRKRRRRRRRRRKRRRRRIGMLYPMNRLHSNSLFC